MKSKFLWWTLGILGAIFLLSSLTITIVEYNRFNEKLAVFPAGSLIAGIPVGELDAAGAEARISDFYSLPLTLQVDGKSIQASPMDLGFNIDVPALVQAGLDQVQGGGYWAALWNRTAVSPVTVPLEASVDREKLLAFLNTEIAPRYTQPGVSVTPIPFTTNFDLSSSGDRLDLEAAAANIETALLSPDIHDAVVPVTTDPGGAMSYETLGAFLRHNINWVGFDGLVELYLESMEDGQVLHFAVRDNTLVTPDVAFTAASTIKVPIMISVLRHLDEPTPQDVITLFEQMIVLSENDPADTLMQYYLDSERGPLVVSEDMAALGLENTFLAGYFYIGAPLLQLYSTPANSRTDFFLDPDTYNQTVSGEAGQLMTGIYQCAVNNTGLLVETFPGEITQSECQLMMDILAANKIGSLIEAGVPSGVTVAHKHGWVVELDGLLHSMSDVAILSTPGGDYILNIFIYDPERLDFDLGNRLIARLSQTVYNFFNLENQAYWWFDTQ